MKRKKIRPFDRGGEWGYDKKKRQVRTVRPRKKPLGDKNLVGARVTEARRRKKMKQVDLLVQLQLRGIDLSVPGSLPAGGPEAARDRPGACGSLGNPGRLRGLPPGKRGGGARNLVKRTPPSREAGFFAPRSGGCPAAGGFTGAVFDLRVGRGYCRGVGATFSMRMTRCTASSMGKDSTAATLPPSTRRAFSASASSSSAPWPFMARKQPPTRTSGQAKLQKHVQPGHGPGDGNVTGFPVGGRRTPPARPATHWASVPRAGSSSFCSQATRFCRLSSSVRRSDGSASFSGTPENRSRSPRR